MKKAQSKKAKTVPPAKSASRPRPASKGKVAPRPAAKSAQKPAPKNVDEYFAAVPAPVRSVLTQIRAAIRAEVPAEATEIISYRIPAFKHKRVLVWYAAFSDHCSLFPTAGLIEQFKDELKGLATSKGTIHFPLDKPMPIPLIRKIVRARMKQDSARS